VLGLVFAALIAAIVASTASKINSISTIFTLDLYAKFKGQKSNVEDLDGGEATTPDERHHVAVGRIAACVALALALITARPLLGHSDQAFQYIQEYTGFFTPGITVIFLLGLFWKRASEAGAITAAVGSFVLSFLFWFDWAKYVPPLGALSAHTAVPFMNRMLDVFFITLALAIVMSLIWPNAAGRNRIDNSGVTFKTSTGFNAAALAVCMILIALYATWW
jgi:SSS family solute:Na+ symporter